METLEYDHSIFMSQQSEADKALAVRFYKQPLKDEQKSVEAGRPIFVDTDMLEIRVRGDRNNIIMRPVRPDDKERFRGAWESYQRNTTATMEGTPLSEWPVIGASMVEELKYLGFFTVEQIAGASDGVCLKVPGLASFKAKAATFLEFAKGGAPLEKMQKQLEEIKSQSEMDRQALKDVSTQFSEMEKKYMKLLEEKAKK